MLILFSNKQTTGEQKLIRILYTIPNVYFQVRKTHIRGWRISANNAIPNQQEERDVEYHGRKASKIY